MAASRGLSSTSTATPTSRSRCASLFSLVIRIAPLTPRPYRSYGKKYIEAAKDTWRLFKDRGIDVLINDCLINNIWTFGSFVVGALCSLFAFLYLTIADPSYIDNNSSLRAALMGFAFILGFFIAHTLGYGCLSAGASTIMTALAYDPSALAELDPQLYSIIAQTYPKVTSAV